MSHQIVALEKQLSLENTPLRQIDLQNELAWALRDRDPHRSRALVEDAYAHAQRLTAVEPAAEQRIAHSLIIFSFFETRAARTEQAMAYASAAREILDTNEHSAWAARAHGRIGRIWIELHRFDEAYTHFLKQLEMGRAMGDPEQEGAAYHDLGYQYQLRGEYQKAIEYFSNALEKFRSYQEDAGESLSLYNLAISHLHLQQPEAALTFVQQALTTAQAIHYQLGELLAWRTIGDIYSGLQEYRAALDCYQGALALAKALNDPAQHTLSLIQLGRLHSKQGKMTAARVAFDEAWVISQQTGNQMHQYTVQEALAELYRNQGDAHQALHHYEQYMKLYKTVFNEENERQIRTLEVIHKTEAATREARLMREKNMQLEREIHERERAERALIQAQKLESLGILAGGVAHDFNNLLTAMIGYNSIARAQLKESAPARAAIDKSLLAMERATTLARQMLAYSGRGHFQLECCDLNKVILENQALLASIVESRSTIQLALADQLPTCQADQTQLSQILVNLVLNASEAEATSITLTTSLQAVSETDSHFWQYTSQPLPATQYVSLTVADNGVGMDETTRLKLFDPFYTTKFTGRGLGLAAVLGIVRGHCGGITVNSSPGEGTQFTLLFPAQLPAADEPAESPVQSQLV